jgi:hypothetical protein
MGSASVGEGSIPTDAPVHPIHVAAVGDKFPPYPTGLAIVTKVEKAEDPESDSQTVTVYFDRK